LIPQALEIAMRWSSAFVVAFVSSGFAMDGDSVANAADAKPLVLNMRSRVEVPPETGRYHTLTKPTEWNAKQTAIVICDMWDKHWCPNSTLRVAEMAPRMNEVVKAARSRGVFIIHCPSDTMEFYKDTPQRKLAQSAPQVETKRPLERWCRIDPQHESPLPIDDTDGGCDCDQPVKNYRAWSRQIADIEIHDGDAITDNDEAFLLMKSRGITNVIVMGVHTNMCVLGRPFSIRQMVYQGMNVALMRDMTDTMYNPAMKPFVSHFTGNDLIVEHIEKFWCPTITSVDILAPLAPVLREEGPGVTGIEAEKTSSNTVAGTEAKSPRPHPLAAEPGRGDKTALQDFTRPFRFKDDHRPHLVILCAEDEYRTEITLPEFAAKHLGKDFQVSFVFESPSKKYDLPGVEVVNDANVLLISVRRRPLPKAQLDVIRKYIASGKPVVGIRTASHAFHLLRDKPPEGLDSWVDIDKELIGGNYQGHTGNTSKGIIWPLTDVKHPILTGIPAGEFPSGGTLYLNTPLDPKATELMRGRIEGNDKHEPVAWTFTRKDEGRTFYTSLGHKDDFEQPAFRRLLLNGIYWAAGLDVPPAPLAPALREEGVGVRGFEASKASATRVAGSEAKPPHPNPLPAEPGRGNTADAATSWRTLSVPGTWEQHAKDLANYDGFAWYRCEVKIPENWKGRGSYLYIEKIDNASECFINGVKVGVSGAMPPKYANGVENMHRYVIPPTAIKPGEMNVVAIRVYDEGGAGGFKGGAPQVVGGNEAISLEGNWQFRVGDDLNWANAGESLRDSLPVAERPAYAVFEKLGPAPKVSQFATVIRREAQQTALSPQESMDRFKVPDDLQVDLVLAEPIISQPLFLNFDERGRLWVMEYRQYPEPAGLKLLSKDQWWRAVYDKVPEPPPHGEKGRDRISIHEDTNGDGVYDKHTTFVDGLNIATAFVQGRGGVWVLNPPYLLFYPDRNGDDVPDGDPEVHLSGFGLEDTHSVINSLRWGPDGWLYAAQGSTVSAAVRVGRETGVRRQETEGRASLVPSPPSSGDKAGVSGPNRDNASSAEKTPHPNPLPTEPGRGNKPVFSQGQNIWRYHPEKRIYEIFSEGGGNAFGVEIDSAGRIFSGHNGGNTRGFHYMQGAYLQKGFSKHGPLSNPYAFGYFPAMEHHNVPRFTHEFLIYEGRGGPFALPDKYRGKLFGAAAILNHVVISDVDQVGSTFKTKDIGYAIESSDTWFRPVDVKDGPDGGIYVADWYDGQLAHTANYQGGLDRDHGRIYRIRGKRLQSRESRVERPAGINLGAMSSAELVALLDHPDRWHREAARRVLADRRDTSLVPALRGKLFAAEGQSALETLWALNLSGGFDEVTALKALDHAEPQVRLWTVRLLGDDRWIRSDIGARIASLAATEPNIEVRCQLAATAKRLPPEQSLPIIRNLLLRDEDAAEQRQPLMVWWALEAAITNSEKEEPRVIDPRTANSDLRNPPALRLFEDPWLWSRPLVRKEVLPRLMRRFASTGQRADLSVCAKLLKNSPTLETTKALMQGFEEAYAGRSLSSVPPELVAALAAAGGGSLSLKVRQGDASAVDEALQVIADEKAPAGKRTEYASLFGEVKQQKSVPVLLETLTKTGDDGLKAAILTALQAYGDPQIATAVLAQYGNFNEDVRTVAQSLLVSRKPWSRALVDAVERGEIAAASLPLDTVRRLTIHKDDRIASLVQKHWGSVEGATTADMQAQIERYATTLVGPGDPYPGKKLYLQMCGKCHTLHAQGGKIGPDLTTYKRDDVRQMLIHIVNPSAEIREGFETQVAILNDGRVVTGFLVEQDPQAITLRSPDGQTIALERSEIDELVKSRKSLMPEGQLKELSDEQLRDLFAYLRSSQPLND
jgi:putative membrane-bound dehydrogenase-like protein